MVKQFFWTIVPSINITVDILYNSKPFSIQIVGREEATTTITPAGDEEGSDQPSRCVQAGSTGDKGEEGRWYETMQSLLMNESPRYREAFHQRLLERLGQQNFESRRMPSGSDEEDDDDDDDDDIGDGLDLGPGDDLVEG
jgi:hypothetical protein